MTPTLIQRSKGWSMPSGSTMGRSAARAPAFFVQEGIAEDFHTRLKARMAKLRIGDPLDKCIDVGALGRSGPACGHNADGRCQHRRRDLPRPCRPARNGLPSTRPPSSPASPPAAPLMHEEIFGPVLVSTTFRTPTEAVEVANNTRYGLAGDAVDGEPEPRPRHCAETGGGRGLGERHQPVRRRRPFRRGPRKRVRARRRVGRAVGLSEAQRETRRPLKAIAPFPRACGPRRPRPRPHRQDVCRRQAGAPRRRLFATGLGRSAARCWVMRASATARISATRSRAARGAGAWARTSAHNRAQVLYYIAENLLGPRQRIRRAHPRPDRLLAGPRRGRGRGRHRPALQHMAPGPTRWTGAWPTWPIRGVALAMREPVGVHRPAGPRRVAASGRDIPDRARHRDGQSRGAGAVAALPVGRDRPSTRCSTRPTFRAGGGEHRHGRSA